MTWFSSVLQGGSLKKFPTSLLDNTVIDGALHGMADLEYWLGRLLRYGFDLPVVNGAGDGPQWNEKDPGQMLRRLQNGKVQHYMGLACAADGGGRGHCDLYRLGF